jgi:autotransporter translocation and assembly factor TamB
MPIKVRRIIKWAAYSVLVVVLLVAVTIVGGLLWLRTSWGGDFVRGQIESQLEDLVNGEVRVGRVSGDMISGIVLEDFAMVGHDGIALVDADKIIVNYALAPFFERRITLSKVRLENPDIHIVRYPDGRWNFKTLFKPRPPRLPYAPPGWGTYIDIHRIEFVDGDVQFSLDETEWPLLDWSQNELHGLNGRLDLKIVTESRGGPERRFVFHDLAFRTTAPVLDVQRLDGEVVWTKSGIVVDEVDFETAGSTIATNGQITFGEQDSLALEIDAPLVGLDEWRRFFPAIRLSGNAEFKGRIEGPIANSTVVIDASTIDTGGSVVTVTGALVDLASIRLNLDLGLDRLVPEDIRLYWAGYPFEQPLSGSVRLTGPPRRMDVDADLRTPAGGLTVDGMVGASRPLRYNVSATTSELDIGELIGRPDVEVTLSGGYVIEGQGTREDELAANVTTALTNSSVYQWNLESAETSGQFVGWVYQADSLTARMVSTEIRGRGAFGLSRGGIMEADVRVDTRRFGDVWPNWALLGGRASATAQIRGTYGSFDVISDVGAGQLELGVVTADSFSGRVTLEDVTEAFAMQVDGALEDLRIAGLTAETGDIEIDYRDRLMNIDGTLLYLDESSTGFGGVADFRASSTAFTLRRFAHSSPDGAWVMADDSRLTIARGMARFEAFRVTEGAQSVEVDGSMALTAGTSDLDFAIEQLHLIEVARMTGQPSGDWEGQLTINGSLGGTLEAPIIAIDGDVSAGRIRGFRFARIQGDAGYADRNARVNFTVTTPTEGHDIVLTGEVPIDLALVTGVDRIPNRPINLNVRGRNTDMSLLGAFIPGLTDLQGPVDLRIDFRGTTEEPRFEGLATLEAGRFRVAATGVTYRDIVGQVAFNNDRVRIERLTGTDGARGTFAASGEIEMENLQLGAIDIALDVQQLRVLEQRRQQVQVGGSITLTGTTASPLIGGQVEVEEAIYRLPEQSKKQIIDLDEATLYVEIPGIVGTQRARSPSLWTRTRLDLVVRVTDDAIFTASNARIEIEGDLSLFKSSGTNVPTFSGTLTVLRGFYEEFAQRFEIQEGEVFFFGTPELNPGLHIVATRTVQNVEQVGDVELQIIVGGTLSNPTIDLESTPPYDKSEIIAIALFGSPNPSTASEQDQLKGTVTRVATGALASIPLQRALASEVGLDSIEISQREETSGKTATLFRVGKFITPDVYITAEQEVGGEEDRQAVGIRYKVSRIFALQATVGTRQSAVDLFWEFSY